VRYIPEEQLPASTRNFVPKKNHKSWGRRLQPLGAWRITGATRTLIVLEGLFDMLITAQKLHELGRETDTVAVYTNGSSPSAKMLAWFSEQYRYEYILIRDPDHAGLNGLKPYRQPSETAALRWSICARLIRLILMKPS